MSVSSIRLDLTDVPGFSPNMSTQLLEFRYPDDYSLTKANIQTKVIFGNDKKKALISQRLLIGITCISYHQFSLEDLGSDLFSVGLNQIGQI